MGKFPNFHPDYSPQDLLNLGLSERFVGFVCANRKPKGFDCWCESPHSGWPCHVPPDVRCAYPLWTSNADPTAVWVRDERVEFVRLYHDDPTIRMLARTEQGVLLELFLGILENEDWNAPEAALSRLRELADFAGFRHLDELNAWHERNGGARDFAGRWREFHASIDR